MNVQSLRSLVLSAALGVAAFLAAGQAAVAEAPSLSFGNLATAVRKTASLPPYYSWMHGEITSAWQQGFRGQNTTITVVDDFRSGSRFSGNLGTGVRTLRHGEWTRLEASMIAPSATMVSHDYSGGRSVALRAGQLNTLNLSYGMFARAGYAVSQIGWSAQETSIIDYARNGSAVVVKAAGNDGIAIGSANAAGNVDYLNSALTGTSAIFVGALSRHGTPTQQASLASYSNRAGSDARVQEQYLVVGVTGNTTGLYGTSFAAPIVSGYSAVLGSKFTGATPVQIRNQLLNTARTDTILGYDPAQHGRGEASIARALAPVAIK